MSDLANRLLHCLEILTKKMFKPSNPLKMCLEWRCQAWQTDYCLEILTTKKGQDGDVRLGQLTTALKSLRKKC
jgi:hypothetical protein